MIDIKRWGSELDKTDGGGHGDNNFGAVGNQRCGAQRWAIAKIVLPIINDSTWSALGDRYHDRFECEGGGFSYVVAGNKVGDNGDCFVADSWVEHIHNVKNCRGLNDAQ